MKQQQALKIIDITKNTYELIGGEFADTRNRPWPEMELLVKKYVQSDDKVLDVGCGNGRLLKVLPRVNYYGVDASMILLKRAEELAGEADFNYARFKKIDILELYKLKENNFDKVFMLASFNHIPGQKLRLKILGEIRKLLKPGGLLIMTNWNMWQWQYKKSIWRYKIKNRRLKGEGLKLDFKDVMTVWQTGAGHKKGTLYYRAFTRGELRKLFKKSGFEVLENYYSLDGKRAPWWRAKNIVTVGKLTE